MTDWLQKRAQEMRRSPTEPEIRLWWRLSNSQLGGFKFRRQYRLGRRVADFFCPAVALLVEVDGDTHDVERDAAEDATLVAAGYAIIRFSNADVL